MSVATNLLPANTSNLETDTSGWTAGSNTTLARSTTRFYAGAASLQLTATASGSVTATTSSRVAVTGGSVYTAYAYFANVAAASGRAASVRVDWYAAVTGGSVISSVTTAAKTLANDTSWLSNTPPPVLVATAPSTAAYASVTVTVTGMSAGAAVVADVISIGPPNAIAGNLIPYTVQGVEVDASGWSNLWNATVGTTSTTSYEGWRSLTATATATGAIRVGTVSAFPVTAEREYLAYAWVYSPITSGEFHTVIRWYDAAGTQVGTSSQTWTLAAADWTRCAVIDTAPTGATSARLILEPVATAVGQVWTFDQLAIRPAPVISGNLLRYNAQGMEVSSFAWEAESGCDKWRDIPDTGAYEGVATMRVTADGTGDAVVRLVDPVPVTPRQTYKMVPYIYQDAASVAPVVDMLFTWRDANGTTLRDVYYRWTTGTAAGWYAPIGGGVAPDDAATLSVALRFVAPDSDQAFQVDNVYLGPGGMGVLVDVIPDAYGTSIELQGLTTGGHAYWGLWRMLEDGTLTAVRGTSGDLSKIAITGDLATAEDYEAPLGASVTYYLKLFDTSSTSYLAVTSEPVVIDEPEDTMVVIKDPGLPARQTTAVVSRGGMPEWTRSARQGVNAVRGRARPVIISDVRTSRTGTMTLVTETQDELDSLWWLLETGNTLLIQWPTTWGERDIYVQVGDVSEGHVSDYAGHTDRTWSIPLTEVDRPIGGVTGSAARTWQDVLDEHDDWLSVFTNADRWIDVYTGVQGG